MKKKIHSMAIAILKVCVYVCVGWGGGGINFFPYKPTCIKWLNLPMEGGVEGQPPFFLTF